MPATSTFILIVSPPIVTVDPNNVTVKVYDTITFVCSAIGLGDFSFKWESSDLVHTNERFLTINSVLPKHQGQYKCIAMSSYSNLSSIALATLNIKGNQLHILLSIIIVLQFLFPSTIV